MAACPAGAVAGMSGCGPGVHRSSYASQALALWPSRTGDKKVVFQIPPRQTKEDVLLLKELIEAGKFRPVIDRTYPMQDVIEATKYVETEQKTGNVVLRINGGPSSMQGAS